MPPSTQSMTVDNVSQFIEPIADITEIVTSNTPKDQPSYLGDSPNCITHQAIKKESSAYVSPARKRQKVNDDNFPETIQTVLSKMSLDSISKYI